MDKNSARMSKRALIFRIDLICKGQNIDQSKRKKCFEFLDAQLIHRTATKNTIESLSMLFPLPVSHNINCIFPLLRLSNLKIESEGKIEEKKLKLFESNLGDDLLTLQSQDDVR